MLPVLRRLGRLESRGPAPAGLPHWSIRKKLLVFLVPAVVVILAATGIILNIFSNHYLELAIGRSSLILTLAQAREVEMLLDGCREDIVSLAHRPVTRERLRDFLETASAVRGHFYAEAAYVGNGPENQLVFLHSQDAVEEVPPDIAPQAKNSPLLVSRKAVSLKRGQVGLSELVDVYYPPMGFGLGPRQRNLAVVRLTTPVADAAGGVAGYLVLSIDARALRNVLSLYNSARSPVLGFSRTTENRQSIYVDERGWMLFQSENVDDPKRELSVDTVKFGLSGDHGKPGYDDAFRPGPRHEGYWRMVSAIQQGRSGMERNEPDFGPPKIASSDDFIGYAPVRFTGGPGLEPEVVGGIIYIDRSLLPRAAEFGQINILFLTTMGAIVTLAGLLVLLARLITRPLTRLTEAVREMRHEGRLHELELPDSDLESATLKRSINRLIASLLSKELEIKDRDERLRFARAREKVPFIAPKTRQPAADTVLEDLVGESPVMQRLFERIRKVAATDADVLLIGETGTGKELTAEAIHRLSHRVGKPFISINCGALDENLLMDALFGHVRGAFSEAKGDRKGAFVAADGGTLLLDEIGNASPRVQQALLRALAVRRVSPLGSDQETSCDVRVIAATNVQLRELVAAGAFREDLYYRLQVLSVATPALRERREDIPLLAGQFLRLAARHMGKSELFLSRGALDKLEAHAWPGNVRELKNSLIRAAALAERDLILAEDIHFEEESGPGPLATVTQPAIATSPVASDVPVPREATLSGRQREALRSLVDRESFSRQDYQDAGGGLPPRTAQHDLLDLVRRGIVQKQGRGPSTRYRLPHRGGR